VWLPRFACPECRTPLVETGAERFACVQCGRDYDRRGGVWRFLTTSMGSRLDSLLRQARIAGCRSGRHPAPADYYRRLPTVPPDHPHAAEWRLRRETYHHLLGHVLAAGPLPLHVLDLGAGSGWLSHRLTSLGHRAVAVDAIDDEVDGLGAARHYANNFATVQADFDALPFALGQFDLIVFNRSLHYAADTVATLERAHRMLAQGGALVVMDSPLFDREKGSPTMTDEGGGRLTLARLATVAERLALQPQFVRSRGSFRWRLGRGVSRLRNREAPATFGLWVAR
jgi:SAM-dependent methyltransferase